MFYQPLASRIRASRPLTITIADLLRHALIESDNSANDMLIREVGGPGVVAQTIADKGLRGLAVGGTERDVQTKNRGLNGAPSMARPDLLTGRVLALAATHVRDQALATYLDQSLLMGRRRTVS